MPSALLSVYTKSAQSARLFPSSLQVIDAAFSTAVQAADESGSEGWRGNQRGNRDTEEHAPPWARSSVRGTSTPAVSSKEGRALHRLGEA